MEGVGILEQLPMLVMIFTDRLFKVFRLMRNEPKHREVPSRMILGTIVTKLRWNTNHHRELVMTETE